MRVVDFTAEHIPEARELAYADYIEEHRHVLVLPTIGALPDFTGFADNSLGVAAFEGGTMIGFLCCYDPWNSITANAVGTFSPAHAHGTVTQNRPLIYKRLYQAAAEKWAQQKISWHAICLYAHDVQAVNALFTYGFGLRCIDAVRPMEEFPCASCDEYTYIELPPDKISKLLPHKNALITYLGKSPMFMCFPPINEIEVEHNRQARYFCAIRETEIAAFIEVTASGEHFASGHPSMQSICGAYCLPEHRGKGVSQNLLNFTISTLKAAGYSRLGVDFESFNPMACGFWLKYFTAYTNSVVRRIDERILEVNR